MPSVIVVDTNGSLKEQNVKSIPDTCKKTGELLASWNPTIKSKTFDISVYGKTNGRAGQENKFEFPPPVDSALFFGKCVVVNSDGTGLKLSEWNTIYEHLYGGFDDVGDDDSDESDEDMEGVELTKSGYAKDDFVVDDDEDEDDDDEEYRPK